MDSAENGIELIKKIIQSIFTTVSLFKNVLDCISWQKIAERVRELDRYLADYSFESVHLICRIIRAIKDVHDQYYSATQIIYNLSGSTTELLTIFMDILENRKCNYYGPQNIFVVVLANGVDRMIDAYDKIVDFSESLELLAQLQAQLSTDFDTESSYFEDKMKYISELSGPFGLIVYEVEDVPTQFKKKLDEVENFFERLQKMIYTANETIVDVQPKLRHQFASMMQLKHKCKGGLSSFVNQDQIRGAIGESVQKLIDECKDYLKSHGKNELPTS